MLSAPFVEGAPLAWRYFACKDDHLVDLSQWSGSARFVRVWAYVEIESQRAGEVPMQLFTNGPADVWIRGAHAHRSDVLDFANPKRTDVSATLEASITKS